MMASLPDHLEKHLGTMAGGWTGEINVALFENQPEVGVSTYVTMGLSRQALDLSDSKSVRMELLTSVYREYDRDEVAGFLQTFAESLADRGRALRRGDVVGPGEPLISGVSASCIYAAIPVFFDDDFATLRETDSSTVLVWVMPVLKEEAHFIRSYGWDPFETALEESSVDFWDLDREPLAFKLSTN